MIDLLTVENGVALGLLIVFVFGGAWMQAASLTHHITCRCGQRATDTINANPEDQRLLRDLLSDECANCRKARHEGTRARRPEGGGFGHAF